MTIIEAINKIDDVKPNSYTESDKVSWLSKLDGIVKRSVIDTHEDGEEIEFNGYTDDTPKSTVLLVGEPFCDVYISWLEAQIDYHNSEYGKYNNSITRFNDTYKSFENDYNRCHMPLGSKIKYF